MDKILNSISILTLLICAVCGYSTYPRRYTRDSDWGDCPSQCQCVTSNSRGPRDLFSDWANDEPWYSKTELDSTFQQDSNSESTGRSMICQGLRQLPSPLPSGNSYFRLEVFLQQENKCSQQIRLTFQKNQFSIGSGAWFNKKFDSFQTTVYFICSSFI